MRRRTRRKLWAPVLAGVAGTAISLAVGLGHAQWDAVVIGEAVTVIAVVVIMPPARRILTWARCLADEPTSARYSSG